MLMLFYSTKSRLFCFYRLITPLLISNVAEIKCSQIWEEFAEPISKY